jgi:phage I-like protein
LKIANWLLVIWRLLTTQPVRLANETHAGGMLGLANEVRATEDWFQVTPIGDFRHAQGLQRVDVKAVEAMANEFNSIAGKVQRTFVGRPIWIGHHDLAPKEYPDSKAYGWINAMEARADGLYAKAKWTPQGKELLESGAYKFHSPYWDVEKIGQENGRTVYRPKKLISAGLTNEPNIPVQPLANEKEHNVETTIEIAALVALLGLANTATKADVTTAITSLKTEAGKVTGLANDKSSTDTALANERTAVAAEKTEHGKTKTALANVIAQRNELALANAIAAGRITPAEKADWATKLAADWDENSKALANKKKTLKTESALGNDAGSRRMTLANTQAAAQFREKVETRMANTKCLYAEAWNAVKAEHPALFEEMDAATAATE